MEVKRLRILKTEIFKTLYIIFAGNSVLPENLPQLTNKSLDSIRFSACDIAKIMSCLCPNKDHDFDMFGIRMIKLLGDSICKLLLI